jgi:hypothetical protein
MGTWGVGGFENDVALDWAFEFGDADLDTGLALIRAALTGADDQLATAAAEMVIIINGHPKPEPPDTHDLDILDDEEEAEPLPDEETGLKEGQGILFDDVDDEDSGEELDDEAMAWIERTHPASDPNLTDLARRALARVTGPDSQQAGEWLEEETEGMWRAYVAELAAKLG